MVQKKYSTAEAMYAKIKEEVCQRALALDEAVSQSTQVRFWGAGQPRPAAGPQTLCGVQERQTPSGWFQPTAGQFCSAVPAGGREEEFEF